MPAEIDQSLGTAAETGHAGPGTAVEAFVLDTVVVAVEYPAEHYLGIDQLGTEVEHVLGIEVACSEPVVELGTATEAGIADLSGLVGAETGTPAGHLKTSAGFPYERPEGQGRDW